MLRSLDFLSSKPEILLFGEKQQKSYFGAVLSILNYTACMVLMIWFFQDWLFSSKPQLIQTIYSDLNTNVSLSQYPIAFNLLDGSFKPFLNQERIFGVEGLQYNSSKKDSFSIQLTKCNNNSFGDYSDLFSGIPYIETFFCVPPNQFNLFLSSVYGSPTERSIHFVFNKCTNETYYDWLGNLNSNRSDCYSNEEREIKLSEVFLSYHTVVSSIDHESKVPTTTQLKSIFLPISTLIFKRFYIYFKHIDYFTDTGIMMKSIEKLSFSQFDFLETNLDLVKSSLMKFAQISMYTSGSDVIYQRSYQKVQQTFASMGGIFSALTIISSFIVSIHSQISIFTSLSNIFFDFGNSQQKSSSSKENIKIIPKPINENFLISRLPLDENNQLKIRLTDYICLNSRTKEVFKVIKQMISLEKILESIFYYEKMQEQSPDIKVKEKVNYIEYFRKKKGISVFKPNVLKPIEELKDDSKLKFNY